MAISTIQKIDLSQTDETNFAKRYVGAIIFTHDRKILLQHRPDNWRTYPGCLSTFGGAIEPDESPMQALIRELNEEVGAQVLESDVISLGAITEECTHHSELVYTYFWHDKNNSITGCYEAEARHYDKVETILAHPKVMDDVRWLLQECQNRELLKPDNT